MRYFRGHFLGYNRLFEIVIAMKFEDEEVSDIVIVNELENVLQSANLIAINWG